MPSSFSAAGVFMVVGFSVVLINLINEISIPDRLVLEFGDPVRATVESLEKSRTRRGTTFYSAKLSCRLNANDPTTETAQISGYKHQEWEALLAARKSASHIEANLPAVEVDAKMWRGMLTVVDDGGRREERLIQLLTFVVLVGGSLGLYWLNQFAKRQLAKRS